MYYFNIFVVQIYVADRDTIWVLILLAFFQGVVGKLIPLTILSLPFKHIQIAVYCWRSDILVNTY